jgi:hypothetical protein
LFERTPVALEQRGLTGSLVTATMTTTSTRLLPLLLLLVLLS